MATLSNNSPWDLGVILDLGSPPTAPNDKNGTALVATAIDNTVWQPSTAVAIARGTDTSLVLEGKIAGAGTAKIRIEVLRVDPNNSTIWNWASIQSTRRDTGITLSEHTIAAAELVGVADATKRQDIVLQTSSPHGIGQLRVIVKWQQASAAGDYLLVSGNTTMKYV